LQPASSLLQLKNQVFQLAVLALATVGADKTVASAKTANPKKKRRQSDSLLTSSESACDTSKPAIFPSSAVCLDVTVHPGTSDWGSYLRFRL